MHLKALKYLLVFTLPLTVAVSFLSTGWLTFLPLLYAFLLIPLLELMFKPNPKNADAAELELKKNDRLYDYLLYAIVPVHYGFLAWFMVSINADAGLGGLEIAGRITAMGLLCGVLGINVAHELGHRVTKHERFLAKALLLTSLYMHFYIEHNRGHHKNVSTPADPSSARKNEPLQLFWFRSVFGAYKSAWHLENERVRRKHQAVFSLHNEMVRFTIIQLAMVLGVLVLYGASVAASFFLAAVFGFLLLETVNYIEHYGLARHKVSAFRYENTQPQHSWNSDHILGRLLLFELSRHSDHHFNAAKKYQLLEHYDESPQMPTGYPGMMILAFLPPVWFRVMNWRVAQWNKTP